MADNKYYTNLSMFREGLAKKKEEEEAAKAAREQGSMNVGGMDVTGSDAVRLASTAAPLVGSGLGALAGGIAGSMAGGVGALPGAAAGAGIGGSLGAGAGALGAAFAEQMDKQHKEDDAELAEREALILQLLN